MLKCEPLLVSLSQQKQCDMFSAEQPSNNGRGPGRSHVPVTSPGGVEHDVHL